MVEDQFDLPLAQRLQAVEPPVIGRAAAFVPENGVPKTRHAHAAGLRVMAFELGYMPRRLGVRKMQ